VPLPTQLTSELETIRPLLATPYQSLDAQELWSALVSEWGDTKAEAVVTAVARTMRSASNTSVEAIGATIAAALAPALVSAAVPLITSMLNPKVIGTLMSSVMGMFGKKEISFGNGNELRVPRGAVLEMVSELVDRTAAEIAALDTEAWTDESVPELRLDTREARCDALLNRLNSATPPATAELVPPASVTPETNTVPATPEAQPDLRERIIKRVDGDKDALHRFRAGVTDTSAFPYSAICQFSIRFGHRRGIGTGFFIAPGTLLTAAHNVVHPELGEMSDIDVFVARNGDSHLGKARVSLANTRVHPQWNPSRSSADHDLALIQVPIRPRAGKYFMLRAADFNPASGVLVAGYAAHRQSLVDPNRMNVDRDSIRDLEPNSFTYSLHTTGGTSGSPVFYMDGREAFAIGVHSRTSDDEHNRGCRLTPAKIAWIRSAFESLFEPMPEEDVALHDLQQAGAFGWS